MDDPDRCPMAALQVEDLRRAKALEQAVIYANAMAHAVRKEPEQVVAAAAHFLKFLTPEPEAAE